MKHAHIVTAVHRNITDKEYFSWYSNVKWEVVIFIIQRLDIQGVSKKFGESYHKINKTKETNKFPLLSFKIVAIRYNTRLRTFVQLPETIGKGLLWNVSQNGCHTIFDGIHVRKTCTLDSRLHAEKQEKVRRNQIRGLRRVIKHNFHLLSQEFAQ